MQNKELVATNAFVSIGRIIAFMIPRCLIIFSVLAMLCGSLHGAQEDVTIFSDDTYTAIKYRKNGTGGETCIYNRMHEPILRLDTYNTLLFVGSGFRSVIGLGSEFEGGKEKYYITFYYNGMRVKRFFLRDLFVYKESYDRLYRSFAHLIGAEAFLAKEYLRCSGYSKTGDVYRLALGDKSHYEFQVETGEVAKIVVDAASESRLDELDRRNQLRQKLSLNEIRKRSYLNAVFSVGTIDTMNCVENNKGQVEQVLLTLKVSGYDDPWVEISLGNVLDKKSYGDVKWEDLKALVNNVMHHPVVTRAASGGVLLSVRINISPSLLRMLASSYKEFEQYYKPYIDDRMAIAELTLITNERSSKMHIFNNRNNEIVDYPNR